MKVFTAWVCVNSNDDIFLDTIALRRGVAIELFMKPMVAEDSTIKWSSWRNLGYRCVKITCTEATE